MLYVIKENKLYLKVSGNYNITDFQDKLAIEDDRPDLVWDSTNQKLVTQTVKVTQEPNPMQNVILRKDLHELMRGSALLDRVLDDGEKSLKLNIAVTLLIAAITTTKNVDDFKASLKKYLAALQDTKSAKELTDNEKEKLQSFIDQSTFHGIKLEQL